MMPVSSTEVCVIYKTLYIPNGSHTLIGEGKSSCCSGGSEAWIKWSQGKEEIVFLLLISYSNIHLYGNYSVV